MKQIAIPILLVCGALMLSGCGGKKKSENIIAPRVVKAAPKAPIQMQEYTDERVIDWIGKTYHIAIHRTPADSLSMVKDENGQQFVDNVFTLAVSRADGSVFFSRKFTKADFLRYITADFRKTGILEGIVFDKADGDWLVFAASIGRPETDEYLPLVIRLSRMAVLEVRQDTQMDTAPDDGSQQYETRGDDRQPDDEDGV